jgi:hypothetical protein
VSAIGKTVVSETVEAGGAVTGGSVVWTVDDVAVLVAGAALDDGAAVETTSDPPDAGASPPNPPANWNVAANVAAAALTPISTVERFTRTDSMSWGHWLQTSCLRRAHRSSESTSSTPKSADRR